MGLNVDVQIRLDRRPLYEGAQLVAHLVVDIIFFRTGAQRQHENDVEFRRIHSSYEAVGVEITCEGARV